MPRFIRKVLLGITVGLFVMAGVWGASRIVRPTNVPIALRHASDVENLWEAKWHDVHDLFHTGEWDRTIFEFNRPATHLAFPPPGGVAAWQRHGETIHFCASGQPCKPASVITDSGLPHSTRRLEWHGLSVEEGYFLVNKDPDSFGIDVTTNAGVSTEIEIAAARRAAPSIESVKRRPPNDGLTPNKLSFLAFSCIKPFARDASTDSNDEGLPLAGLQLLEVFAARAEGKVNPRVWSDAPQAPTFALGLGDQIYVDPKPDAGFSIFDKPPDTYDGDLKNPESAGAVFETLYPRTLLIPPLERAFRAVPVALMWDDHELGDGAGSRSNSDLNGWKQYQQHATNAFWAYQGLRNTGAKSSTLDFEFRWGKHIRGLLVDTRSNRSNGVGGIHSDAAADWQKACDDGKTPDYHVLACSQHKAIEAWLDPQSCKEPTLYVLGLNSPISWPLRKPAALDDILRVSFPSGRDDVLDTWASHEKERAYLLDTLKRHFIKCSNNRLLILAGDVHQSGISTLHDEHNVVFGHEIISSGLANSDTVPGLVDRTIATIEEKQQENAGGTGQRQGNLSDNVWSDILMMLPGTTNEKHVPTPSFAEIFVEIPVGSERIGPPQVKVVFYAGVGHHGRAAAPSAWAAENNARDYYSCVRGDGCPRCSGYSSVCRSVVGDCEPCTVPLEQSKTFTYIPLYLGDDRKVHCPQIEAKGDACVDAVHREPNGTCLVPDCEETRVHQWVQDAFVWAKEN